MTIKVKYCTCGKRLSENEQEFDYCQECNNENKDWHSYLEKNRKEAVKVENKNPFGYLTSKRVFNKVDESKNNGVFNSANNPKVKKDKVVILAEFFKDRAYSPRSADIIAHQVLKIVEGV